MSHQKSNQTPDMAIKRSDLEQLARDRFAFLTESKGFVQRPTEQSVFATSEFYVRTSGQIGMQVQIDFRDETVRVYLLRMQGDKLPPRGFVAKGERVRISFLALLRDVLHIKDQQLEALSDLLSTKPSPRRDYQFADAALAGWSAVVERYIDTVIQQSLDVLFPPPPPNASVASQA